MQRYEKYKDSGIEWIGEIPEHWETKRFAFLFSFSRGLSITKQDLKDLGIPCINYGEIHSKYGFEVNPEKHFLKCVDENYLNSSINSLLKRGDFVFADTSEDIEGSGNFTCLDSDIPTFAGYHTIIARPKYDYNYRFIAYFFDSLEYRTQIQREVVGIKVFSITQAILKNTNLILPTVQEQTTIASFLDRKTAEIDQIIANKQKLIALYEEEKQAIINHAVTKGLDPNVKMKDSGVEWLGEIPEGWEVKRIRQVAKIFGRIGYRGYTVADLVPEGEGAITISPSNMKEYHMDFNSCTYLSWEKYEESPEIKINNGDLLFVKTGSTYGKTSYVSNLPMEATINPQIIVFKEINCNSKLLWYNLKSENILFQVEGTVVGGTIPTISQAKISNYYFPITPELKEQQFIVEYIEKECSRLDAIISKFNKQIDLLQEYRTTLISEVVTGKIKVYE